MLIIPIVSDDNPTPPVNAPDDDAWMRRALELARLALEADETPVGAVVVRDGRVLGAGRERTRERLDPSAHAEVEAVREACSASGTLDLAGASLYTTVEPCVLCAYAVRITRIARVVYGVDAGAVGAACGTWRVLADVAAFPGTTPPEVRGGVLTDECARVLAERRGRRKGAGRAE